MNLVEPQKRRESPEGPRLPTAALTFAEQGSRHIPDLKGQPAYLSLPRVTPHGKSKDFKKDLAKCETFHTWPHEAVQDRDSAIHLDTGDESFQ